MKPECKDCYHALDQATRCGKYQLVSEPTPLYAPVKVARSLPRVFAWLQGECGRPGRFFEPRYPF